MKRGFSGHNFEKYSNINFQEDPSSGSIVVPCGQTAERAERHDEANSRYSNFSNAPKNRRTF